MSNSEESAQSIGDVLKIAVKEMLQAEFTAGLQSYEEITSMHWNHIDEVIGAVLSSVPEQYRTQRVTFVMSIMIAHLTMELQRLRAEQKTPASSFSE